MVLQIHYNTTFFFLKKRTKFTLNFFVIIINFLDNITEATPNKYELPTNIVPIITAQYQLINSLP